MASSSTNIVRSQSAGLGLGLGLPSTFAYHDSRSRSVSTATIVPAKVTLPQHRTVDTHYLFPMPMPSTSTSTSRRSSAQTFRRISVDTVKIRPELVSYWSPNSDCDDEYDAEEYETQADDEQHYTDCLQDDTGHDEDQEEAGDQTFRDVHPEASHSQPLAQQAMVPSSVAIGAVQLSAHACLHMLSPKGHPLANAAGAQGLTPEEAICEALEYAWLVPFVTSSDMPDASEPVFQAPAMISAPSWASSATSISLSCRAQSNDGSLSPSEAADSNSMSRSQSVLSSISTPSTAATSVISTSIIDRKRPVAPSYSKASGEVIQLTASRSYKSFSSLRANDALDALPAGAVVAPVTTTTTTTASTPSHVVTVSRRSTHMSIHSMQAVILNAEDDDADADDVSSLGSVGDLDEDVLLRPMLDLPSPGVSTDEAHRLSHVASSLSARLVQAQDTPTRSLPRSFDRPNTRKQLYGIWAAAEESERVRRHGDVVGPDGGARVAPHPQTQDHAGNLKQTTTKRVATWVNRVRKSASTNSLRAQLQKQQQHTGACTAATTIPASRSPTAVADPVAWASSYTASSSSSSSSCGASSPSSQLGDCFEPRSGRTGTDALPRQPSIHGIVKLAEQQQSQQQQRTRPQPTQRRATLARPSKPQDLVWTYLG